MTKQQDNARDEFESAARRLNKAVDDYFNEKNVLNKITRRGCPTLNRRKT